MTRRPLPRCHHGMAPGFCVVAGCQHEERRLGPAATTASRRVHGRQLARCCRCGTEGAVPDEATGKYRCGPCQREVEELRAARSLSLTVERGHLCPVLTEEQ